MEFRVLGTFEVTRRGSVVTPSAPKLRQVLALLALRANSLVHTRQLVDELWEDNPPASSSTTLQTYIYQLRKLLDLAGQNEHCTLHTRPSGYVLAMPQQALDLRTFEELAGRGADELQRGDVAAAAESLRAALAIWRGPVLSDVTCGPILEAETVQVAERGNTVLEMRLDADLALGRYQQLISELTGQTARHPTHEGMHGRLMLALYHAGRRSEALEVYQRVRDALAEELGLEPGRELQRIHRSVLAADPELDTYANTTPIRVNSSPQPADPPAQLPPEVSLVGRDIEAAHAEQQLLGGAGGAPATLYVMGTPGVGTSAFCVHLAHRVRHAYGDGQFFASFTDTHGPAEVLAGFLEAIGVPKERIPTGLAARSAQFRTWTADRKVLVVLDNATSWEQISAVLPSGQGCATIIAGARRMCQPAVTDVMELAPLSPNDSLALLMSVAGAKRVLEEPDAAHTLVTACAGLPMVLRAAGARLAQRPHWRVSHLANRAATDARRLHELSTSRLDLRRSVGRRYQMLRSIDQEAFHLLARHVSYAVTPDEAAVLLDTDPDTAESILERLAEHLLAEVDVSGDGFCYRLHPLVRLVAHSMRYEKPPAAWDGDKASAVNSAPEHEHTPSTLASSVTVG